MYKTQSKSDMAFSLPWMNWKGQIKAIEFQKAVFHKSGMFMTKVDYKHTYEVKP